MRTWLVLAGIAVILGGVPACTNDAAAPSATSTSAAAADSETAVVCAQAISEGTDAVADFKLAMSDGVAAVMAGDTARATALEAQLHARVAQWAIVLTDLSEKRITPELKALLSEASTTLTRLNRANDRTSVQQVETKFAELGTRLAAVCA